MPHATVDWMAGFDEGRTRGAAEVLEALEAALVAVGVGEDVGAGDRRARARPRREARPMSTPRAARKLVLALLLVSLASLASVCHKNEAPPPAQERPRSFGPRTVWLAFRGTTTQAVAKALDLREVAPLPWTPGLVGAYAGRVFATPPIDGWVLATSTRFPDMGGGQQADGATPLLARLSKQFDEVQYFGTHEDIGGTRGRAT